MQIRTLLRQAVNELKEAGSDSPRLDAELLMMYVSHLSKVQLITHDMDELGSLEQTVFNALLQKRKQGHPIAHLLGERDFWDLTLKVTPDTLIPRPDTEVLVEKALTLIDCNQFKRVLDLGTGSGAIILSLKHARPQLLASAVDFSPEALLVAMENAQRYVLDVDFYLGSWFEALGTPVAMDEDGQMIGLQPLVELSVLENISKRSKIWQEQQNAVVKSDLEQSKHKHEVKSLDKLTCATDSMSQELQSKSTVATLQSEQSHNLSEASALSNVLPKELCFDMIVSNPPYIEDNDPHLSQGDVRFEPLTALTSGTDGLDDIRQIIAQSVYYLNDGGYLLLEHGYNQGAAVRRLLQDREFENVETIKDYGLNERVTLGRYYHHQGSRVLP